MRATEEVRDIIDFAEEYKPGWRVTSLESFRYKDTGERLWSVNMVNTRSYNGGPGEVSDRLLIHNDNGIYHARSVQMQRWDAAHYRRSRKEHSR